jgi:hypothetical protein
MTDTPAPLTDEQRDELLSADLDGEFDTTARDLGFEPDVARARLDATPGVAVRRAALAGARDLLAEVPTHDELALARIRAEASREVDAAHKRERTRRRSRWLTTVGSVAAAIVLVVGIGLALGKPGGSSSKSSASSAGGAVEAPVTSVPGQSYMYDAAPTPRALADTIHNALLGASPSKGAATRPSPASNSSNDAAGATPTASLKELSNGKTPSRSASAGAQACAKEAKGFAATTNPPSTYGTAAVAGKPVLYAVYREGNAEVIVILTPECGLLLQQTFPRSP